MQPAYAEAAPPKGRWIAVSTSTLTTTSVLSLFRIIRLEIRVRRQLPGFGYDEPTQNVCPLVRDDPKHHIGLRRAVPDQDEQSTATERAAPICRIRTSPSRPRRSTRTATDTLSTESRFTAERRGTGSSLGSRTTSGRPADCRLQGATTARRSRGMAVSQDKTTTGRLPASRGQVPIMVMTRSARARLRATTVALFWSVVRAQATASSRFMPCC